VYKRQEMERAGVVGPLQSNGSREVLAPAPVDG
jgi:DNA segregation ATPase FtsK/SpoIIIE-like protein